jgi:hypothetical protein
MLCITNQKAILQTSSTWKEEITKRCIKQCTQMSLLSQKFKTKNLIKDTKA